MPNFLSFVFHICYVNSLSQIIFLIIIQDIPIGSSIFGIGATVMTGASGFPSEVQKINPRIERAGLLQNIYP
jgi:hypothetical protein